MTTALLFVLAGQTPDTPSFDVLALVALVVSIVLPALAWLLADAKGRGRNEAMADRVKKLEERMDAAEGKIAEVRELVIISKQNGEGIREMLSEHMELDRAAFASIAQSITTMQVAFMARMDALSREIRDELREIRREKFEDTNPGRQR